jgi:hypothetical protein
MRIETVRESASSSPPTFLRTSRLRRQRGAENETPSVTWRPRAEEALTYWGNLRCAVNLVLRPFFEGVATMVVNTRS